MTLLEQAFALAVVVWFATTVLVEGEITRPLREAVERWAGPTAGPPWWKAANWPSYTAAMRGHPEMTHEALVARTAPPHPIRLKLAYLAHCHMCAGTWVGLLVAAATPYRLVETHLPLGAWFLTGLIYKGIAHLILAVNHCIVRTNQKESI